MEKTILLAAVLLAAVLTDSKAQNWSGSTPGSIYYNSGYVCIGTSNPLSYLDVKLATNQHIQFVPNVNSGYSGASGIVCINDANTAYTPLGFYASNYYFGLGNMGIGTTTPGAKLEVNGDQKLNGNLTFAADQTAYFIKGPGNGGAIRIRSNIGNASDRNVQFGNIDNNGTWYSYMIVDQTGNVGIGTTTPDELLSVNGTIHSKEVKVNLTGLPDYVFKPAYRLPSLAEVKSYIDKNQHLPEVPSAAEVEENGLNLGEMNKLLLKKVEELTLYLIEENRRNDFQQQRINKLERQLKSKR